MNIATALLQEIKQRQLDMYCQLEESMAKQSKTAILEALNDPGKPNITDKLRLYLLYLLAVDLPANDAAEMEKVLSDLGITDLSAVEYVKRLKAVNRMTAASTALDSPASYKRAPPGSGSSGSGAMGDMLGRVSSRLGGTGLSSLLSNVKSFLPSQSREAPLTRMVARFLDPVNHQYNEGPEFVSLDPKRARHDPSGVTARLGFEEAIVCVVGGGGWQEQLNLTTWAQRTGKNVIYGATQWTSPEEFVEQLKKLGK